MADLITTRPTTRSARTCEECHTCGSVSVTCCTVLATAAWRRSPVNLTDQVVADQVVADLVVNAIACLLWDWVAPSGAMSPRLCLW